MGKFRQSTMDQWEATRKWMFPQPTDKKPVAKKASKKPTKPKKD